MRLRTQESFWLLKNGLLFSYPSLQNSIKTQVVVVGAGITGALITHALLDCRYEVILIEKRDVGFGSTAATTAMLQYEIDVPLFKLAKAIGEENAVLCYKEGISAIYKLNKLIKEHKIECGFKLRQSLYFSHNANFAEWLYKEFKIREKHNFGVK